MVNKKFKIIDFVQERPLSWSAISSFEYDPEQWYQKYYMGIAQPSSPEMEFGKTFADACEVRKPLAPVTMLSKMEHEFKFMFGEIPMIGYADTHEEETRDETGEYKTGVKPWDQKRVDTHGQVDMYALGNWVLHKMKPQDCKFWLEWIPTMRIAQGNGAYRSSDYKIAFASNPPQVHHFDTKRSMRDVLQFGVRVQNTLQEMESYVRNHA